MRPHLEANFDQPSNTREDFLFRRQFTEKQHLGFMPGCPDMLIIALQEGNKQGRPERSPCFSCASVSAALRMTVCLCLCGYVLLIYSNTSIVPSKINFHTRMQARTDKTDREAEKSTSEHHCCHSPKAACYNHQYVSAQTDSMKKKKMAV